MLRRPTKDKADADRQGGRRWSFPDWRRCLEKIWGPRDNSSEHSERPTRKRRLWLGRAAPPEPKFNFLRLPAEVRHRIYCLLLVRDEAMTVLWRTPAGRSLGILRVCKVTWREATPVLYKQNQLDFSKMGPEEAEKFLKRIGSRNAGNVRHLVVDFPGIRFDPTTLKWEDETHATTALAPYAVHCRHLRTLATSHISTVDIFLDLPQLGRADDIIRLVFDTYDARQPRIRIQVSRRRADWEFIRFHSSVRGWKVDRKEDGDSRGANGRKRRGAGVSRRFLLD